MISLLLTLTLAAGPAKGLGPETVMAFAKDGLSEAKVGEWVTYRLDGGRGRQSYLRLAVVGETKDEKGRPSYWLELEVGDHPKLPAPLIQMAMLVSREKGFTKAGVQRMFIAAATGQLQELERPALEKMIEDWDAPKTKEREPMQPGEKSEGWVRETKPTQLMTLAGTVTAKSTDMMYRETIIQRIWVSDQIPLVKLAKIDMPAIGHSLEVRDFGIDARPRIRLPGPDVPKLKLEPQR